MQHNSVAKQVKCGTSEQKFSHSVVSTDMQTDRTVVFTSLGGGGQVSLQQKRCVLWLVCIHTIRRWSQMDLP